MLLKDLVKKKKKSSLARFRQKCHHFLSFFCELRLLAWAADSMVTVVEVSSGNCLLSVAQAAEEMIFSPTKMYLHTSFHRSLSSLSSTETQ